MHVNWSSSIRSDSKSPVPLAFFCCAQHLKVLCFEGNTLGSELACYDLVEVQMYLSDGL